MAKIEKSDQEWRELLTPEQYHITRKHGTERAFTGPHQDEKRAGTFKCVCCGKDLFKTRAKFDSGTGWPSFSKAAEDRKILERVSKNLREQREAQSDSAEEVGD